MLTPEELINALIDLQIKLTDTYIEKLCILRDRGPKGIYQQAVQDCIDILENSKKEK